MKHWLQHIICLLLHSQWRVIELQHPAGGDIVCRKCGLCRIYIN